MIELRGISKSFGHYNALTDLNYSFSDTGLYVINGSNGAGKSTLFSILANIVYKTSGCIEGLSSVSYLPERYLMPPFMSSYHYLRLTLPFLKKIDIYNLLKDFAIPNKSIRSLSKGNTCKLAIAHITSIDSAVYLFDEVFDGLDEKALEIVKNKIKVLSKDKLVIMILHNNAIIDDLNPHYLDLKNGGLYEKE